MSVVTQGERASPNSTTVPPSARRSRWRWTRHVVRVFALVLAALLIYLIGTFIQVWQASNTEEAATADAIIVLGAAQYDGEPSPVLTARLDHAADLFRRGLAPQIVVTGGGRPGDRFTEAGAGAAYLESLGIPGTAIERETTSTNTWESLAAVARFLRRDGLERVILVSDPFHSFRIQAIADELGLDPLVSPTPTSPMSRVAELRAMLRETAAVAVGRIIGYSRLLRLDHELNG